jgi:hypothetical protein
MALLAVRLIDLAIFASLGGLWIGGGVFIVLLYRWILRFERGDGPSNAVSEPVHAQPEPASRERVPPRVAIPEPVREGLVASPS